MNYDLRTKCGIYSIDLNHLVDKQSFDPKPFTSQINDSDDNEIQVILQRDFYELVQKSESDDLQKLDTLLNQIGAMTMHAGSPITLIKVEVLMAAMRVHGQD